MFDSGKILTGIAVFLIVVTFPIWYTAARGGAEGFDESTLDKPTNERCVLEKDLMRTKHMEILDDWRDSVVRHGMREVEVEGLEGSVTMSLTEGCLSCHKSYENFCQKCHDYADVTPYCWDCHIIPGGK